MIRSNKAMIKGALAKFLAASMLTVTVVAVPNVTATAAENTPKISDTKESIVIGKDYNLDINNKIKGSSYQWVSSNEDVATVTDKGIVTGVDKGTVTITCNVKASGKDYKLTSKITVRTPAEAFKISNKVTALNLGQKWNFDRTLTPKSSNDLTTWTTSDKNIAAPDAKGKFTALKEGIVTITGKTISGKSDKVTIRVVDANGTVTTQKELEELLGSGVSQITIKTDATTNFTVPAGDYSNQKLVVDAPKADVTNSGVFKSIEIKNIKSETWTELADGNNITVSAPNARIIVSDKANATINVAKGATNITLVNKGKVELSFDTKVTINVVEGATGITLRVPSADLIPTVTGTGNVTVVVGTGDNTQNQTVTATPVTSTTPTTPAPSTGGDTSPSEGNKKRIVEVDGKFELPVSYTELEEVVVNYNGLSYLVSGDILDTLVNFLSNDSRSVNIWKNTTDTDKTYSGQGVNVNGTAGDLTKTVTFTSGLLSGKAFTVTVDPSSNSVTISGAANTYTITKVGDKTLTISSAPAGLSFDITY